MRYLSPLHIQYSLLHIFPLHSFPTSHLFTPQSLTPLLPTLQHPLCASFHSIASHSTAFNSIASHPAASHSIAFNSTASHSTAFNSTASHSPAFNSTASHSAAFHSKVSPRSTPCPQFPAFKCSYLQGFITGPLRAVLALPPVFPLKIFRRPGSTFLRCFLSASWPFIPPDPSSDAA